MCKKNVTCYGVVLKDQPQNILTFIASKEEALEYIDTLVKLSYQDSYRTWAFFNKKEDLSDPRSWKEFARSRIPFEVYTKYRIVKCKLPMRGVALAFRLMRNSLPVGCSFEEEVEFNKLSVLARMNEPIKYVADALIKSADINPKISEKKLALLSFDNREEKSSDEQ